MLVRGGQGGQGPLDQEDLDELIQDSSLCFLFSGPILNPQVPISSEDIGARTIFYKTGKPLQIKDEFEVAGVLRSDTFTRRLGKEDSASLENLLIALRNSGVDFPDIQSQIEETVPLGDNWTDAKKVQFIWRHPSGEILSADVLLSLNAVSSGPLRGVNYPQDMEKLIENFRGSSKEED